MAGKQLFEYLAARGETIHTSINDFAGYLERQTSIMERSGWQQEAVDLRNWASELRRTTHLGPQVVDFQSKLRKFGGG